jgi:hypothetical protein
MALNLSRNSKVFFTTNVNSVTGVIRGGGFYDKNTYEIQVLDGFTFSQNTNNETVTLSESGTTPTRAQRSFNTSLAPADFSFSTYIRPKYASSTVSAEEEVLWNALFSAAHTKTVGTNIALNTAGGTLTYNGSTTLTVTGTALGAANLAVNDVVMISGVSGATLSPVNVEVAKNYFNAVATVSAKTGDTSITFTYTTPYVGTASAFTLDTANTLIVNKVTDTATIIGNGGTGNISTIAYQNLSTNAEFGILTVSGTSLPTGITANEIYNVSFTGVTPTGAAVTFFAAPAVLQSGGTSGVLKLRYLNATTTATTFTVSTPSITLTKASPVPYTNATEASAFTYTSTATSDKHQLLKFGLLYIIDNVCYALDNCVLNEATIDFALDGIATVAWSGQGTAVRKIGDNVTANAGSFGGFDAGIVGKYAARFTDFNFITNKLSSAKLTNINDLKDSAGATKVTKGDTMTLAITGGSLTISNNITYLTPSILGIVNQPKEYFTGSRAITGNLTAYLRTGATPAAGTIADTGELLNDMLAVVGNTTEPMFSLVLSIGGTGNNTPKVQLDMPSIVLSVPTIDAQQVVTTTINFTAEGSELVVNATNTTFDLAKSNDLTVRYYSK